MSNISPRKSKAGKGSLAAKATSVGKTAKTKVPATPTASLPQVQAIGQANLKPYLAAVLLTAPADGLADAALAGALLKEIAAAVADSAGAKRSRAPCRAASAARH